MSTEPLREVDIAIIGGGLGGLALAVGLRRRGLDAHVFESGSELRKETSTMIGLGPNAFAALADLHPELPEDIRRRGVVNAQALYHYRPPGREPFTVDRPASHTRLYTVRWAETQSALARLVPPHVVHTDHAATGFEEEWEEGPEGPAAAGAPSPASPRRRPAARAVVHFRSQPSVRARLVVGADGVFSAIRAAMFPGDPGPRYLGHMNWNCVLYNPGGNTVVDAHKPGQLQIATDGCVGEELRDPSLFLIWCDAGGGYTFWQCRMQYDEPSFTSQLNVPDGGSSGGGGGDDDDASHASDNTKGDSAAPQDNQGTREAAAAAAAGAGAGAATDGDAGKGGAAPASGEGGATTPTATAAGTAAAAVSGKDSSGGGGVLRGRGGQGVPGSKARVMERLKAAGWDWALPLVSATPESALFERALYDRLPLPRWASAGRRAVLLGDAAHAMHPGPGQGARSAFEDAHQLSRALGESWPDVPAALETYQKARIVRANRVQALSAENCGLASIREAARPAGLSPSELYERWLEFRTWFDQYPANMDGDPGTKWWKPPQQQGQQQGQGEQGQVPQEMSPGKCDDGASHAAAAGAGASGSRGENGSGSGTGCAGKGADAGGSGDGGARANGRGDADSGVIVGEDGSGSSGMGGVKGRVLQDGQQAGKRVPDAVQQVGVE